VITEERPNLAMTGDMALNLDYRRLFVLVSVLWDIIVEKVINHQDVSSMITLI
jgi:hypothetical protein